MLCASLVCRWQRDKAEGARVVYDIPVDNSGNIVGTILDGEHHSGGDECAGQQRFELYDGSYLLQGSHGENEPKTI